MHRVSKNPASKNPANLSFAPCLKYEPIVMKIGRIVP